MIAGVGIKCKDIFAIFKKSNFAILKFFFFLFFCIFPHFPSWYFNVQIQNVLKNKLIRPFHAAHKHDYRVHVVDL